MNANGTVFKYGDNVDTDVIIPARYLNITDRRALAAHCMEDIDRDFAARVQPGDVVVAGANFGCGSSREHAPLVLRECGVALVLAQSFARIFYRNAINIGLPIVECPAAAQDAQPGDKVRMDFDSGIIYNETQGKQYNAVPFPPFIQNIIRSGGLVNAIADGTFSASANRED